MIVLTYRRGKFDTTEKNAIKHHLDLFKTVSVTPFLGSGRERS